MIIPSYSGFASTPDAAGAFLGGAGLVQRRDEANQNFAAAMARIQNDRSIAEMNNAARQQALQQEMLQKQQELEVEKAYQQSMIGLKQMDLQREQAKFDLESQQVSRQFDAQEKMRQSIESAIAGGSTPQDAFTEQAALFGPEAGLKADQYNEMFRTAKGGASTMGDATLNEVPGREDYEWFQTGPNSRQLVKKSPEIPDEVKDIPGTGYERIGGKVVPKRESADIKALREDRKRLKESLESKEMTPNRMAMAKSADPKAKLSATDKFYIEEYKKKQEQLADIDAKLNGGRAAQSTGGTTNRVGRFKIY